MMAAAQAAAEAALQEALANEGSQQASYSYSDEALYSNPAMYGGADSMRLMESLQATDPGGQALLLQDLMGMPQNQIPSEDENTNQLLQLLAQQEQHQQQQFAAAAEAVVMMRPEKHYITISQNGK
jgi:hypothetical protein